MGKNTAIAWTHHTFNPVWGCEKVSPGCDRCYAETFDRRVGGHHWGPNAPRRTFGPKHWTEPYAWNRAAEDAGERRRVFCGSMCDVFDAAWPDGARDRLWTVIRETPHLDWLLLTKRPENIASMLPALWGDGWSNVWLGVTVENADALWRVDLLRKVPAALRFVSCEPLLDAVVFPFGYLMDDRAVQWVIVGGESGPKPRPMDIEWARAIQRQCAAAGSAFFAKQLGGHPDKRDVLGDFPEDLRIREFPEAR